MKHIARGMAEMAVILAVALIIVFAPIWLAMAAGYPPQSVFVLFALWVFFLISLIAGLVRFYEHHAGRETEATIEDRRAEYAAAFEDALARPPLVTDGTTIRVARSIDISV